MNGIVTMHPQFELAPGTYLLDGEGRLHFSRYRGFIQAVAIVHVRCRSTDDVRAHAHNPVEQAVETRPNTVATVREECAAEAAEKAARTHEAKRLTTANPLPQPATQRRADPPLRSLARREKPTPVQGVKGILDDHEDDDELARELPARVKAKRAQRSKRGQPPIEARIDGARVAAAFRAKSLGPAPKKSPTRRAMSDGECHRCGVRTTIGCEHFLPFLGDAQ